MINPLSPFEHNHHVIAAIWFDFSFGTENSFSVANVLNALFFDGRETFSPEKGPSHGQVALFDLLETAISTNWRGNGPVEIWNLRGNGMLNAYSKYLDLIFDSASSILIFSNKQFIPIKYINTFKRKLDIFKALTSGIFQNDSNLESNYFHISLKNPKSQHSSF